MSVLHLKADMLSVTSTFELRKSADSAAQVFGAYQIGDV